MSESQGSDSFRVRIKRQDGQETQPYWHEFELAYRQSLNVISVLQEIAANPVTSSGQHVSPPVWEAGCLEKVCGSCTMLANGQVRQVCSVLVDELLDEVGGNGADRTITLSPMTKFPVIRDLVVDRSRMFNDLQRLQAWVPIDSTQDLGPGPRESPATQQERYALSRCMTCGCCLEACPQYTKDNHFVGAASIGQALLFNEHETGSQLKDARLETLMGPGGISDCGNAQNCVKVCPKDVPLTDAIAKIGRQTSGHAFKKFFTGK